MEREEDATSKLQNLETYEVIVMHLRSTWIEGVNWEYIRRSKDVLKFSWTSYVGTTYFLYPVGEHPVSPKRKHNFHYLQRSFKDFINTQYFRKVVWVTKIFHVNKGFS